ncbi:MAG: diguanylate cyclase domain-containing protein [Ignavibacteriales bacterium]
MSSEPKLDFLSTFNDMREQIPDLLNPELVHETSDDLFRTLYISAPIGIFIVRDGKFQSVNPQFQTLTGFNKPELYGLNTLSVVLPEDQEHVRESATRMLKGIQTTPYEYRIVTRDGQIKWIMETVASIQIDGELAAIGSFMDIDERKQIEEKIKFLSLHDSLTGLYNRAYFEEELRRLEPGRFDPLGVIVCDVDGLKLINDTLGHDAGDALLKGAAEVIRSCFRENDVVARVGGDEFAILLPLADEPIIEMICHRIKLAIDNYNAMIPELQLSISIGFACRETNVTSIHDLYKIADNNMYKEKLYSNRSARSAIVSTLMKALEVRDFITEGHAERLRYLVVALGKALGLPETTLTDLRLLAEFHDIGKVGIPDRILFKPGHLTDDELPEMQRHSEIGHRIALSSPDLVPIAEWILKHHEWWDGRGYPLGLASESIPLECRILSIADAYDAMTSDRPYRKAMSQEKAVAELINCSGTQFDPEIVKTFLYLLKDGGVEALLASSAKSK